MDKFIFVTTLVENKNLSFDISRQPVYLFRRNPIRAAVSTFKKYFAGTVLYAVKTNPNENALREIYASGVRCFDAASLWEIQRVKSLFTDAKIFYMHPVKNRADISDAYFKFGVRDFSLDSFDELEKILAATGNAEDLNLHIRLAVQNGFSQLDLSGKYGIGGIEATKLISVTRRFAKNLGVCFHVGSQCMNPVAYENAIKFAVALVKKSGVAIDSVDVGGGFPSAYPDMSPVSIEQYLKVINNRIAKVAKSLNPSGKLNVYCEPGRALVAESGSVLVHVDARKGDKLYINDGTYGSLFDAGSKVEFQFPTRAFRRDDEVALSTNLKPFSFYGPTCDSLDAMKGPFMLPDDIREGDFIEIGQLGAYGMTFRTAFNGFYSDKVIEVEDAPMLSMYGLAEDKEQLELLVA
jgi:ornithine decarboxylase